MARDKLITVRIEGEKRQAFGDLAKSQNTDTASLLYDFISGCLDGTIDISLVTGKKQWIDKIDNQLDSERIDKLETATQEIGERLDNWIWVSERSLENNLNSLRDQVNALAIQLNRQQIDRIDTDSQKDSQQIDDMGTVATVETADTVESVYDNVETADTVESVYKVEIADKVESVYEPDKGAIGPVRGDSIEPVTGEGEIPTTHTAIAKRLGFKSQTKLNYWITKGRIPSEYADKCRFNESKTKIVWII
jgi:hypothetical protein